ncbi:LANO_0H11386g1_1 [Lachancea nothofagi CBS 11611]|uniref:Trafficking protein particle complex subunit n=1 Tax=Lachancea nothofagi CBS 11611 TaxID=1266666 RepID=A0A1G4KMI9_9SACH|nr:LANO_0H11386g1_1 [Lachancea nothofagi CBS 11611]
MSQKIINPSTSVAPAKHSDSTGYDYTIGPQQTLPNAPSLSKATTSLPSVYNESLHASARNPQVSLAAYAFLFQELVTQARNASKSVSEIELRLHRNGYHLGIRLLELLNFRSSVSPGSKNFFKPGNSSQGVNVASSAFQEDSLAQGIANMKRRDLRMVEILQFIHGTVWSYLFGRVGDDLVKSSERENEFMIIDNSPLLTRFISSTNVQCDFFVCGIIEGILDSASFPCNVTAHSVPEQNFDQKVVFVVRFEPQVLEREALRS